MNIRLAALLVVTLVRGLIYAEKHRQTKKAP